MGDSKIITTLSVITDSETNQQQVGDIEGGGFDQEWLREHIQKYGVERLLNTIAWMSFQVYDAFRDINSQNSEAIASETSITNANRLQ